MKTKSHKFPLPADYRRGDPLIFCPNDRVIAVYNQHTGDAKKSMAKTVKEWFITEAKARGWVDCQFTPIAQSPTKSAGCVLFHPTMVSIKHQVITINLTPHPEAPAE